MSPVSKLDLENSQQEHEEEETVPPAMVICTKLAGRAIIRVVTRCNDAQENSHLDLSECQLMQVPDAVYHLMRHTTLKTCNLTGNVIRNIPPKFAINFSSISELNLSHNQICKLPDELADLASLERLDISYNTFIAMPHVVYNIPKLTFLNASNNSIIELDVEELKNCRSIRDVDLTENPLPMHIRSGLANMLTTVTVTPLNPDYEW